MRDRIWNQKRVAQEPENRNKSLTDNGRGRPVSLPAHKKNPWQCLLATPGVMG